MPSVRVLIILYRYIYSSHVNFSLKINELLTNNAKRFQKYSNNLLYALFLLIYNMYYTTYFNILSIVLIKSSDIIYFDNQNVLFVYF